MIVEVGIERVAPVLCPCGQAYLTRRKLEKWTIKRELLTRKLRVDGKS